MGVDELLRLWLEDKDIIGAIWTYSSIDGVELFEDLVQELGTCSWRQILSQYIPVLGSGFDFLYKPGSGACPNCRSGAPEA